MRWYDKDPLSPTKNRGAGLYYGRGKGYLSKYSRAHDRKILAFGSEVNIVGLPSNSAWLHISDGKIVFRRKH